MICYSNRNIISNIQMKKESQNEEITRIIERENVITFKRKGEGKGSVKSQKDEDDDLESAKSHPSEEPSFSKGTKKSIPLPELNKEKKRLILRNILPETKIQSNTNYLDKEVRQQDNIMLKNMNNHISHENMKLKTKNMNLEKEIVRLQKMLEEDPQKLKIISSKDIKVRSNESNSLKIVLRNMQKQLDDVKKQNSKIKTSIKFTTISQLEVERDNILEETIRLRQMLEEERNKIMFLKANQHGISAMEQKLMHLQDKTQYLTRQNNELKSKVNKDDRDSRSSKVSENEKNLNKMLFNARRVLKEKERQLDILKNQLRKQSTKIQTVKTMQGSSGLQNSRVREVRSELNNNKVERADKLKGVKEKRIMSKSAQKYRSNTCAPEKLDQCQNCRKFKDEIAVLTSQVDKFKADLDQVKMNKSPVGELSKSPISIPNQEEIGKLQRFLVHRFKAHHLTLEEANFHLINFEGKITDNDKDISIAEVLQIAMAEPFSILADRYIQTFIIYICYHELIQSPPSDSKCTISEAKILKRSEVQARFNSLIGNYELINQSKEEEMFIQIAELVTQYQQHILKALNEKRNTESTINQKDFYEFFKEIELERDYVEFMICQIILESLDLDHLNIYNLFEIFYMPPQEQLPVVQQHPGSQKKKYNMIESVVKQQDEEYEESKSFMESRHKSQSRHEVDQQNYEAEEMESAENENEQCAPPNEDYEEHFEEEKMEHSPQQEKANEEDEKPVEPQHYNIENIEEQYVQDYQT